MATDRKTPTMLATSALEQIARHERECGMRWAEAHAELKALSKSVSSHAARWEKLAWLVVSTVVCAALATVLKSYL